MELKEGVYVRTKYGISQYKNHKVIGSNDILGVLVKDGSRAIFANREDIMGETSFNPIDLIEPMDLMYIDISPDDCGGIVVPRVAETLKELEKWKERFASGECILKGVVTKEQLKNNSYWIGE